MCMHVYTQYRNYLYVLVIVTVENGNLKVRPLTHYLSPYCKPPNTHIVTHEDAIILV